MPAPSPTSLHVACAIVGGGPAGMMLGFLLARAGVDVVLLEKHGDFLRDFRGDTIHPSTLEVMHELGLLEEFLKRPHQEARELQGWIGDERVTIADFSHLPIRCKFIALMPQWDFLDFLAAHARRFPTFRLIMNAQATDLIRRDDRVVGLSVAAPDHLHEITADLVVGADGRHSTVRRSAGLAVVDLGAPMDVLWLRLSKRAGDPTTPLGRVDPGRIMVLLDRGDYWQCAYVIPKDTFETIRRQGLEAFRADIARLAPFLADRVAELASWDEAKLLTVSVDRLTEWCRPGLLCIGDAAHAMSPIGGVGINLAVQDAVAAANMLAGPLRTRTLTLDHLRAVQQRRDWPTRVTQWAQVLIQRRIISNVLTRTERFAVPWPIKLLQRFPYLRRIPARLVGMGVRPEHVRS